MKLLFVSDFKSGFVGGAEITMKYLLAGKPDGWEIDHLSIHQYSNEKAAEYDALIVSNVRNAHFLKVVDLAENCPVPYIKSEHDMMFADDRLGNKIEIDHNMDEYIISSFDPSYLNERWYKVTKILFENAAAVRYLAPFHRNVYEGVGIKNNRTFISAPYVDTSQFYSTIDNDKRSNLCLILSGGMRGEVRSREIAMDLGFSYSEIHAFSARNLGMRQMRELYNMYKTFIHAPMYTPTFGRQCLEAHLCGCELWLDQYHPLYSFEGGLKGAVAASQRGVMDFWAGVTKTLK